MNKNELVDKLNDIYVDFKSTSVLAELIANSATDMDGIFVKRKNAEQRYISSDINQVDYVVNEVGEEAIVVEVNREGLYDMLPETLFHQKLVSDRNEDAKTKFSRHRKEEASARNFFYPFENEFDKRLLYFELVERQINDQQHGLNTQELFDYFFEPSSLLSHTQRIILLYILPLANKIRGDVFHIQNLLTRLFKRKIDLKAFSGFKESTHQDAEECLLAVNFILGSKAIETFNKYIINIYNLSEEEYLSFQNNQPNAILLNYIIKYVFPVQSEITIQFQHHNPNRMLASDNNNDLILDFNTYI